MIVWIVGGIIFLLGVISIYYINRIIVLSNRIRNARSQIDVQLKRRADLIPNLIESVKGYKGYEERIIKNVVNARERMVSGKTIDERLRANEDLTSALKTIFALAENYPRLRASETFINLQNQLKETENKIAYSRQFYNDTVLMFNNLIKTIPGVFFAKLIGKKEENYLKIGEEERRPVRVEF